MKILIDARLLSKGNSSGIEEYTKLLIDNILNIIAPEFLEKPILEPKEFDEMLIKLDGTFDKSRLGANAILSLSLANTRLNAKINNLPLYKYINKIALFESEFDIKGSATSVQEAQNVFLFNRPKPKDVNNGRANKDDRELTLQKMRRRGMHTHKTIIFNSEGTRYVEKGYF